MNVLRIATRRSPLALWQAEHVAGALRERHPGLECELLAMRTEGDRLLDAPLAKVGGKGLFVKELERALLDERADLAVHSMKDMPVQLPGGLHLPVMMRRADPRDALLSTNGVTLAELERGARVGTSSLRRRCQLKALRPDLTVVDLRGSVDTRIGRLDAGDFDAIVLACAGLDRLGRAHRIRERLDCARLLPAIGQGVMGIECRAGDTRTQALIASLNHTPTAHCVAAERAMNARLDGGCQVPIAGHAELVDGQLRLRGLVATLDGRRVLRSDARAAPEDAAALGSRVAEVLLAEGAGEILREVYAQAG